MSKKTKTIIWIIVAVLCVAAVVTAIIVFRKQIAEFLTGLKKKLLKEEQEFTPEEFEDFADI